MQQSQLQLTNRVLMVRPFRFRSNQMTAINNYFQKITQQDIHHHALAEFDRLATRLSQEGVTVVVVQDPGLHDTPDSLFPNNWVTFHKTGHIIYPLFAPNRRTERLINIFEPLPNSLLLKDYSPQEQQGKFLEGTGSMVLDRVNRIVYAALSPRTNESLLLNFCKDYHYQAITFRAYQDVGETRQQIYHTNVMMWIGEGVCGVGLDCIDDPDERQKVRSALIKSGRQLVELSEKQVNEFAGNSLMLQGKQKLIVMSSTAYRSLSQAQRDTLGKFGKILHEELETIEQFGGGSARCMLAQVF